MTTSAKRDRDAGEERSEPPKKQARANEADKPQSGLQKVSSSSRKTGRRAHEESAMSKYARIGANALAAVQRAQVLLRRVEAEWMSIGEQLASLTDISPRTRRESKFEDRMAGGAMAEALARAAAAAERLKAGEKKPSREELALRVDGMGREIDAQGRVVDYAGGRTTTKTLKANEKLEKKKGEPKKENPYTAHRVVEASDALDVNDPRLVTKKRETKKARAFVFVQEGHYVKIAEATRAKAIGVRIDEILEERAKQLSEEEVSKAVDALPRRPEHVASVPGMEWWDEEFVPKDVRAKRTASAAERVRDQYDSCALENSRFYALVHHPASTKPLAPRKKQPDTMPFYLTKQDRKRVRRQMRAEREREKQDKIQLGLIPPPEPKFKLSNFMKVLGEQAVANPSKMERKVMEQVQQRLQHHEMRNAARKLTPQERKEKKRRKLAEDTSHDVSVAVFYVYNLDSAQHRFKLDINAQQLNLTGGVLICTSPEANFALVVVEGGPRGIRRFVALVTRRIDWADSAIPQVATSGSATETAHKNWAAVVWRGLVVKRAFTQFRFQECKAASSARRVMEVKGVAHYWDMVLQRHEQGPPLEDGVLGADDDEDEAAVTGAV